MPSEGWYEWVKDPDDPKKKQPYFTRLKNQRLMFLGVLAEVHPGLEADDRDGFVIIIADSVGGMVHIHDRRPVVLTPDLAREWLDPSTPRERAEHIALHQCALAESF